MSEEQPTSAADAPVNRDEEIARLAFRFYEEEGRPDGRAAEHWRRAEEEFNGPIPPWTAESGAGDA